MPSYLAASLWKIPEGRVVFQDSIGWSASWALFRTHCPHPARYHGKHGPTERRRGVPQLLADQAVSRSLVFDLSIAHDRFGSSSHVQQNVCYRIPRTSMRLCYRIPRTSMRLCVLLRSARSIAIGNNTLTIRTFLFSLPFQAHPPAALQGAGTCDSPAPSPARNRRTRDDLVLLHVFEDSHRQIFASFSAGPPRGRGTLQCHWTAIATKPIGQRVPVQPRSILPVTQEQSRPRGGKSDDVADQLQCRGVCHSGRPNARSFTCSPSSPPPPFMQSPFTTPLPPREQLCNRSYSDKHTQCISHNFWHWQFINY